MNPLLSLTAVLGCQDPLAGLPTSTSSPVAERTILEGICEGDFHAATAEGLVRLQDCTEITGTLTVSGDPSVTDLSPLARLQRAGAIEIVDNPALGTLAGLDALVAAGALTVESNPILADITLPALVEVDQAILDVRSEEDGRVALPALEIAGSLYVDGSTIVEVNLDRLTAASHLAFLSPDRLETLSLPSLVEAGTLHVSAEALTHLDAPRFQSGHVGLSNTSLQRLEGLPLWRSGSVYLGYNPLLTDIDLLSQLVEITSLELRSNDFLVDLPAIQAPEIGRLDLIRLPRVTTLAPLGGAVVTQSLTVYALGGIADLDGIALAPDLDGVSLEHNDDLVDLGPLADLVSVSGQVTIDDNDRLVHLDALSSLREVCGDDRPAAFYPAAPCTFTISRNEALVDISGLDGLAYSRGMEIEDNGGLCDDDVRAWIEENECEGCDWSAGGNLCTTDFPY